MTYPRVIGLLGKARSGKSTAAQYLGRKYGYHILSFALPLKMLVAKALVDTPPPIPKEEWLGHIYTNRTAFTRWLLQYVGTDIARALDPDIWIKKSSAQLQEHMDLGHRVVFEDVRFFNEANMITAYHNVAMPSRVHNELWRTKLLNAPDAIEHGAAHQSELQQEAIQVHWELAAPLGVEHIRTEIDRRMECYV